MIGRATQGAAVFAVVLAMGAWSCANRQFPAGGSVDVEAPRIIATDPPNNTVDFRGNRISMEIDKYIDQRSFEESVFISPSVGELEFDWSGRDVEITFGDTLRPGTTYVVNIGTDVVDLNNRNRMAEAFTIAFSTGPDIDRGVVEGRVFPRTPGDPIPGVMVFAYRLDGIDADTLNPERTKPDYITQTGTSGAFALRHIPFGSYRILAVRDEYRNLVYDPQTDEYGVQSAPVSISPSDTIASGILLQLAKEDTTAPRLLKAEAKDEYHLDLSFSKWVNVDSRAGGITVADTSTGKPLSVRSWFHLQKAEEIRLVTDRQDSAALYRVHVPGAIDSAGLPISPLASSAVTQGSGHPDTILARLLSVSVQDSARDAALNVPIRVQFSDAVQYPDTAPAFSLETSDGHRIEAIWAREDGAEFSLRSTRPLDPFTWYRLAIPAYLYRDSRGRAPKDSVKTVSFRTFDAYERGAIDGTVRIAGGSTEGKKIVCIAHPVDAKQSGDLTTTADQGGKFSFANVLEGRYVLHAFVDHNRNGIFDPGKPVPFVSAEPVSAPTDTLKVRARWPLDGVVVRFPR